MTEDEQAQAILNGAQDTANTLSLMGEHLAAARVCALIQLARVQRTRLQPQSAPEASPDEAPTP